MVDLGTEHRWVKGVSISLEIKDHPFLEIEILNFSSSKLINYSAATVSQMSIVAHGPLGFLKKCFLLIKCNLKPKILVDNIYIGRILTSYCKTTLKNIIINWKELN